MKYEEFAIGEDDVDRRIDRVLRKFLQSTPLSVIYKNIRSGFIRVNGTKTKNEYRMQAGDVLFVEVNLYKACTQSDSTASKKGMSKSQHQKWPNNSIEFETVFHNDDILIINKPYGINVQATSRDDISLDRLIKAQWQERQNLEASKQSLSFAPGPLHRLDKNTTGLLAFSQSLKGARYFSEAIASHVLTKEYLCVLSGNLTKKAVWEGHLIKEDTRSKGFNTVKVSTGSEDGAKYAKTTAEPLVSGSYLGEDFTLARIVIETGRTHQIRSQSAKAGFALFGDSAYGYEGKARQFFLHAYKLTFPKNNPIELPKELTAKIPKSFKDFLQEHLPTSFLNRIL